MEVSLSPKASLFAPLTSFITFSLIDANSLFACLTKLSQLYLIFLGCRLTITLVNLPSRCTTLCFKPWLVDSLDSTYSDQIIKKNMFKNAIKSFRFKKTRLKMLCNQWGSYCLQIGSDFWAVQTYVLAKWPVRFGPFYYVIRIPIFFYLESTSPRPPDNYLTVFNAWQRVSNS